MSIKYISLAWKIDDINSTEKLVLLCLADNADNKGVCWTSMQNIAQRSLISQRQAIRIISKLIEYGYLQKEERKGKTPIYRLFTPDMDVTPTPDMDVTPLQISPLTPVTPTPDTHVTPAPDTGDIPPVPPYNAELSFEPSKNRSSSSASEKKSETEIIKIFDDAIAEIFGEACRRPFPAGNDFAMAGRINEVCQNLDWLKNFFRQRLSAMKAKGRVAPRQLSYFVEAIAQVANEAKVPIAFSKRHTPKQKHHNRIVL